MASSLARDIIAHRSSTRRRAERREKRRQVRASVMALPTKGKSDSLRFAPVLAHFRVASLFSHAAADEDTRSILAKHAESGVCTHSAVFRGGSSGCWRRSCGYSGRAGNPLRFASYEIESGCVCVCVRASQATEGARYKSPGRVTVPGLQAERVRGTAFDRQAQVGQKASPLRRACNGEHPVCQCAHFSVPLKLHMP